MEIPSIPGQSSEQRPMPLPISASERLMSAADAADAAGGIYDPQTGGAGPEAGTAIGRPIQQREIYAYQAAHDRLMRQIGGYSIGPNLPAPRAGVDLRAHMTHLRRLGYTS